MFKRSAVNTHRAPFVPAGSDALVILGVGGFAALLLIVTSGMPLKWFVMGLAVIFALGITLMVPDKERYFFFCALFFCLYAWTHTFTTSPFTLFVT